MRSADSAPQFGDRKTYQMDPANVREALREAETDVLEGADMLMVKPAMAYLDVVRLLRDQFDLPIVAYNVSGEYSMIKANRQQGWISEQAIVMEPLTGMKRAGADIIITYFRRTQRRGCAKLVTINDERVRSAYDEPRFAKRRFVAFCF